MEVQRIKTEGKRIDPVRNIERLWLALTTKSANGSTVEGHLIKSGTEPTMIEVYADRLPHVLERVRTDAHRRAYEMAVEMHKTAHAEECRRRKVAAGTDLGTSWNGCPEIHLGLLGYRTGIPPIETCEVVHPRTKARVDAREFLTLPPEKQREWLVDAPVTPENAAQRANEHLAETIARVLGERQGKQR